MSESWQVGKQKKKGLKKKTERAVLVGLITGKTTEEQAKEYLEELEFLAMTAGAETIKVFTQKLDHRNIRTFVGKGKLEEIKEYVEENDIDLVIFDDCLLYTSPSPRDATLSRMPSSA